MESSFGGVGCGLDMWRQLWQAGLHPLSCLPLCALCCRVWLASYCQTLVAVKIASGTRHANLTATLAQQETLRNLRSEANLMATLNHPNSKSLGPCRPDNKGPARVLWQQACSRCTADAWRRTPARRSAAALSHPRHAVPSAAVQSVATWARAWTRP